MNMIQQNVHPFPARMASEIALDKIGQLERHSVILDPMTGSGTVIRAGAAKGHRCIGMDVDPLAVLMSKVATSYIDNDKFLTLTRRLLKLAGAVRISEISLPWIDPETKAFIRYWFGAAQRRPLTKIAYVL